MTDIAVDRAELVALFVETLLYGIYVSLFYQTLQIQISKRPARTINWKVFSSSIAIFFAATGHIAVVFRRALDAFIDYRDKEGGSIAYYGNLRQAVEVCQASFFAAVTFVGDCVAVYRVSVVYNHTFVYILLPLATLSGTFVAAIGSIVVLWRTSTHLFPFYLPKLEKWIPAFLSLSVSTSLLSSFLIVARLWYLNSRVVAYTDPMVQINSPRRRIITVQKILIESAALYSSIMLVYLVTYLGKTNYNIVFGAMASPMVGIAFSLITIRVEDTFSRYPTETAPSWVARSGTSGLQGSSTSGTNTHHSATPVANIVLKELPLAVRVSGEGGELPDSRNSHRKAGGP